MTEKVGSSAILAPITIMEKRGAIYAFFSQVFFQEISRELLQQICLQTERRFSDKLMYDQENEFTKGLLLLTQATNQFKQEKDSDEIVRLLAREFVYTFIIKGSYPIYPYESVYRGEEKLLMQKPYDEVKAFYREAQVVTKETSKENEDHISIELEFMSILCEKFIQYWKGEKRKEALEVLLLQNRFSHEHLIKWVPQFCEDVLKKTRMDFYRAIAYLTGGYTILDSKELEKLIQSQFYSVSD